MTWVSEILRSYSEARLWGKRQISTLTHKCSLLTCDSVFDTPVVWFHDVHSFHLCQCEVSHFGRVIDYAKFPTNGLRFKK